MKIPILATALLYGLAIGAPTKSFQSDIEKRQLLPTLPLPSSFSSLGDSTSALSALSRFGDLRKLLPSASSDSASSSSSSSGLSGLSSLPGLGGGSSSETGITGNSACQPLTFIFARGTSEIGNMGTVVGPPVARELRTLTNNKVLVQGVDYPASAEGNALMGAAGGPALASLIKQVRSQCPDTRVLLGGYSQGAMVVHNAARSVGQDDIAAAVLFGDPLRMQGVGNMASSKVKEYCALGDPVCLNGANALAHVSYGADAKSAAQFLVEASGVSV